MSQFSLAELFRYALPGGVFLGVALLGHNGLAAAIGLIGANSGSTLLQATILFGAAFLVGALIQVAQRAVPYVLIHQLILLPFAKSHISQWRVFNFILPSQSQYEFAADKIRLDGTVEKTGSTVQVRASNWLRGFADSVQLMWGAFWAMVLALWIPEKLGAIPDTSLMPKLWIATIVVLGLAFISDLRHTCFEVQFLKRFLTKT